MERLGTARRYQSQSRLAEDPFDELYQQYGRQNGSPPSTPVPSTAKGPPTGGGDLVHELAALEGSIDLLAQRVWELTNVLRMELDGAEEEERDNGS